MERLLQPKLKCHPKILQLVEIGVWGVIKLPARGYVRLDPSRHVPSNQLYGLVLVAGNGDVADLFEAELVLNHKRLPICRIMVCSSDKVPEHLWGSLTQ